MDFHLPRAEFAFPGPLRDALVAAILDGTKTSTTSLVAEYGAAGDPLPRAGDRTVLVDSSAEPLAVLEATDIRLVPLGSVDLQHAWDEGEGHDSLEQWRTAHEEFWHGAEFRESLGDPAFTVDDNTLVVLERFRVVPLQDQGEASGPPPTDDAGTVPGRRGKSAN